MTWILTHGIIKLNLRYWRTLNNGGHLLEQAAGHVEFRLANKSGFEEKNFGRKLERRFLVRFRRGMDGRNVLGRTAEGLEVITPREKDAADYYVSKDRGRARALHSDELQKSSATRLGTGFLSTIFPGIDFSYLYCVSAAIKNLFRVNVPRIPGDSFKQ